MCSGLLFYGGNFHICIVEHHPKIKNWDLRHILSCMYKMWVVHTLLPNYRLLCVVVFILFQDSNQFHAICLDTYPPIFYLNDTSRRIIHLISRYNQLHPQVRAAYTFDAGPNAVLMVQSSHVQELLDLVCHYFPPSAESRSVPPPPPRVCVWWWYCP